MATVHLRLGLKPKREDARTLKLSNYVSVSRLPAPPEAINWGSKVPTWPMYLNDKIGDCGPAAACHQIECWTANAALQINPTDQDVLATYSALSHYDHTTGANDNGVVLLDEMNLWRTAGIASHKIQAYASVLSTGQLPDHTLVVTAVWLFGSLTIGVQLPLGVQGATEWRAPSRHHRWGQWAAGSWGGHCLTGDTKIPLLDGSEHTMAELSQRSEPFWVYSCDRKGNIVPGLAHSARVTGKNRKILKVTLDNEEVVRCTPDHRWLMRDGSYKAANELQAGDSLMPLYRRVSRSKAMNGYEQFLNPANQRWYFTHRMMLQRFMERGWYRGVVHHKNFNKRDNSPDNLELMSWEQHTLFHAENARPEPLNEYAKSDRGRETSRELMQALWADPIWRAKMLASQKERAAKGGRGQKGKIVSTKTRALLSDLAKRQRFGQLGRSASSIKKQIQTWKLRFANDPEFADQVRKTAATNVRKSFGKPMTEKQRLARQANGRKLNLAKWNHKVARIEEDGRAAEVYDLTVERYHNFALASGVFVHNCIPIVAYDATMLYVVSWGGIIPMSYNFLDAYCTEIYAPISTDWIASTGQAPNGFALDALVADMQQITGP